MRERSKLDWFCTEMWIGVAIGAAVVWIVWGVSL